MPVFWNWQVQTNSFEKDIKNAKLVLFLDDRVKAMIIKRRKQLPYQDEYDVVECMKI